LIIATVRALISKLQQKCIVLQKLDDAFISWAAVTDDFDERKLNSLLNRVEVECEPFTGTKSDHMAAPLP
jgi:hypothetical protein